MESQKTFTIGELSTKTGISIRNLRYYDEINLLVPEKHPTSGHRMYKDKDVLTLQKIFSLKFLGYSLEKISELLHQSSFTMDLNKTLSLHLKALEEQKGLIEKSMNTIKRVIYLLKEEGEVDSNLLFSLIQGLPTEDLQKEWLERHELTDVVEELSNKSVEESIRLDEVFVQLSKKVKQLHGQPIDDPDVQEMVESYLEATTSFLGEDLMQELANVSVEEMDRRELKDMTPSPFTEKEQKWLIQAIEYYMEQPETEERYKTCLVSISI